MLFHIWEDKLKFNRGIDFESILKFSLFLQFLKNQAQEEQFFKNLNFPISPISKISHLSITKQKHDPIKTTPSSAIDGIRI